MFERFAVLRATVFLRRISRSLQRANELEEFRLSCEFPLLYSASKFAHESKPSVTSPKAKLVSISHPTAEQWNAEYRKLHPPPLEED